MITCTLGDKSYTVDYITGRALREIEPAIKMYTKIVNVSSAAMNDEKIDDAERVDLKDALDVLVRWFCILFGGQFTADDIYDKYPADRLVHDIALALMAVQTSATSVLSEFPTKAAQTEMTV